MKTPSFFRRFRLKSRGMTLTELVIVLGAMGLVMGGIWAIAGVVWNSYHYRLMNEQLMTVVQNVRNYFDPMGLIYQDPETKTVFADGASITGFLDNDERRLIPITMRTTPGAAGSLIHHALSVDRPAVGEGSFSVYSENSGARFRIHMSALSRADCMKLLLEFPFLMPEIGATGVVVNGTAHAVNPNNQAAPGAGFPMTATTAENWCNIAATKTNGVGIVFRLKN